MYQTLAAKRPNRFAENNLYLLRHIFSCRSGLLIELLLSDHAHTYIIHYPGLIYSRRGSEWTIHTKPELAVNLINTFGERL